MVGLVTVTASETQSKIPPAMAVIARACRKAKKDRKNLLVVFHASYCRDCTSLLHFLSEGATGNVVRKHFVVTTLDTLEPKEKAFLENKGGYGLLRKWGIPGGLPAYVSLDTKGNLIANGNYREGQNLAWPIAEGSERDFCGFLNRSSGLHLTKDELDTIFSALRNYRSDPRGVGSGSHQTVSKK